jgi:hypothetical protein
MRNRSRRNVRAAILNTHAAGLAKYGPFRYSALKKLTKSPVSASVSSKPKLFL